MNVTRERTWVAISSLGYHQHPLQFIKHPILLEELTAASGGGISSLYGTPKYQQGVAGVIPIMHASISRRRPKSSKLIHGYRSGRNYPDVVANADPITGYDIYSKTVAELWGNQCGCTAICRDGAVMNSIARADGPWNPQLTPWHKPTTRRYSA